MGKTEQTSIQVQARRFIPAQKKEVKTIKVELLLKKVVLAALTMLGIGYVLVNVPIAILIGNAIAGIPIASQANINAIAGRVLFLMASIIASMLGVLFILGAVQFYERSQTKGTILVGVLLGSFYLLCLGASSTLLLSATNLSALLLIVAPIIISVSAAMHTSSNTRTKQVGSVLGVAGAVVLAFVIFNFKALDQIFGWNIPFTGPFLSLTVLESGAIILGSIANCANTFAQDQFEEHLFNHTSILLVSLVYGLGALIGSLILSMSFWDLIWKSPWLGPFNGISDMIMSTIVFWSASLVLMDIGGLLLIVGACLGFVCVARQFSKA